MVLTLQTVSFNVVIVKYEQASMSSRSVVKQEKKKKINQILNRKEMIIIDNVRVINHSSGVYHIATAFRCVRVLYMANTTYSYVHDL